MTTSVQVASTVDDFFNVGKTMPALPTSVKLRMDLPSRFSDDDAEEFKFSVNAEHSPRAPNIMNNALTNTSECQPYRPIIKTSRTGRRANTLHPSSPISGVSAEYIAMANACSHDHDYLSPAVEMCSPRSMTKEGFRRPSISPGIIVKKEPDDLLSAPFSMSRERNRTPKGPVRLRTRRILLLRKGEDVLPAKKEIVEYNVLVQEDASKENNHPGIVSELSGRDNEIKTEASEQCHESSIIFRSAKDSAVFDKELEVDITSPRPSITPFPPAERRRSRQRRDNTISNAKIISNTGIESEKKSEEKIENDDTCKASVDSAYSSLSYSSTSIPRTPSGNRPPSGGKRGATCGLTSSSSSGTSSDEWSDVDSPVKVISSQESENLNKKVEEASLNDELSNNTTRSESSISKEKPHPHPPRLHRKISSGKKLKKFSERPEAKPQLPGEKVQFVPAPPARKQKKSKYYRSVPMRLRALPTSFWEEPNRTNPSPYTILPPVQPLFHQQENEDIADIRPVTPPNEKESTSRQTVVTAGCDRPRHRTIIHTGDTDLLWRLFDKVEAKQTQTGIRAKRGRPKRPSYCTMPTPRRALNENPCINSITEKLFPKLTLDHRHPIAAMMTSSGMMSSRPTTDISSEETSSKFNLSGKMTSDIGSNMFLSDEESPSSSFAFGTDPIMEMTSSSPSPTLQPKQSPISLPQLVVQKDYSQLLNELAAVL